MWTLFLAACAPWITDEAIQCTEKSRLWYADGDGDGSGGGQDSLCEEEAPHGYVAGNGDCDDENANAYPDASEACNGFDDDCDGEVDEAGAVNETTWFSDADDDTYGDAGSATTACSAPDGYVDNDDDCDDQDSGFGARITLDGSAFPSLQSAIDDARCAANTCDITLCGTVVENVVVDGGSYQISGINDATIDAGGGGSALYMDKGSVVLSDLTLTGGIGMDAIDGNGGGPDGFSEGGNVLLLDGTLTLQDVEILAGVASAGGGVYAAGGTLVATDTAFRGNRAEGVLNQEAGGGLAVGGMTDVVLTRCTFSGNYAQSDGGGIVISGDYVTMDVTDSIIGGSAAGDENMADNNGGGIYVGSANVVITNTAIDGNVSGSGGGIRVATYGVLSMTGGSVANNIATYEGGGLAVSHYSATLDDVSIEGNQAVRGGGVLVDEAATFSMTNGFLLGNQASDTGDGIYLSGACATADAVQATEVDVGTGNTDSVVYVDCSSDPVHDYIFNGTTSFVCDYNGCR